MDGLAWKTATFVRCRACGRIIDFWEPAGLTIGPTTEPGRYLFTRVDPAEALCPECRLAQSNEEDRAARAMRYAQHRAEIDEIGIPPDVTVYFLGRVIGTGTEQWARDYGLAIYAVKVREWDQERPGPPSLRLTPDDPAEPPVILVWFGADVFHSNIPGAYLRFRWSFADPAAPGRLEIIGWNNPTLRERRLSDLLRGIGFFRELAAEFTGGRPRGSFYRNQAWYAEAYRAHVATLGRQPTQHEFRAKHGIDRKTLRSNLMHFGLWPWDRFVTVATTNTDG